MTQEQLQKWFESCLKYYLDNIQEPKVEDKIKTKYEYRRDKILQDILKLKKYQ